MTHSPASSEDEERHSASECPEGGSESDSSPDGPGRGPRGTRGRGSGAAGSLASIRGLQGRSMSVPDDAHFSMMVFRIGIPDLHQTVSHSPLAGGWGAGDRGHQSARGAGKGMGPPVLDDLTRGPHCQTPMGFPPALLCPGNHPQPSQTCSGPFSLSWRLPHQKCLRFNPDATIWTAKQQVLCALSESLQDVLNYGLFQPATSGRDANFLEEERLLREYPQSFEKGVPYLEVRPPRPSQPLHRCEQALARSPFLHPAQTSARESPVGSSGYKGHPKNPGASLVA